MFTITERAKEMLRLFATVKYHGVGMRLDAASAEQWELFPDREQQGDHVVKHEGEPLLFVSPRVAQLLEGATIDTGDATRPMHGAPLVIRRRRRTRPRQHEAC